MSNQPHNKITVKTINNKGEEVGAKYFEDFPKERAKYPSQNEFNVKYQTILREVERTGKKHEITITQSGISVVALN